MRPWQDKLNKRLNEQYNGSAHASWYVCLLSPAKQHKTKITFRLFKCKLQSAFLVCMFCISIWNAPFTKHKSETAVSKLINVLNRCDC